MAENPHFLHSHARQDCSASHANVPCLGQTFGRKRGSLCDSCLIHFRRAQRAGGSLPNLTGFREGRGKN